MDINEMQTAPLLSLKDWFRRNFASPLLILACLFLVGLLISIVAVERRTRAESSKFLTSQASLASLALQQKNRLLLEDVLSSVVNRLGAQSAAVCDGVTPWVAVGYDASSSPCSEEVGYFSRALKIELTGSRGISVVVHIPLLNLGLDFVFLGCFAVLMVGAAVGLAFRLESRLRRELLEPLEVQLRHESSQLPVPTSPQVRELARLEQIVDELQRKRSRAAVAAALEDRNRRFLHDLRVPLSVLKTVRSALPAEEISLLDAAIERIHGITSDLKVELQSDADPALLFRDLKTVVDERRLINGENSALKIEVEVIDSLTSQSDPELSLSRMEYQRALCNLFENSVDAMKSSAGIIRVRLGQVRVVEEPGAPSFYTVEVDDEGCGVDAHFLPILGTAGFTSGKRNGSGLGLAATRQSLMKANGELRFTPLSRGLRVTMRIPPLERNQA